MAIIVNLDVQLATRKMKLNDLSEKVGISVQNLSKSYGEQVVLDFQSLEIEDAEDRVERRDIAEARAREELAALPLRVFDPTLVASAARLSDACLALRGTYVRDLPRHARVLAALDGDLPAMVSRLAEWADANRPTEAFFHVEMSADVVDDVDGDG